ncbi:MAG: signal peptidase I [Acutalibacteraceae bacterium]
MNQNAKTKIKILINSVLFCILAFLVMIVFIPKILGYDTYYIQSESMSPSISKGSLAFAKEVEFKNISPGDVLTFSDDDGKKFFTHRVVEIDAANQMLTTKGDANDEQDPSPTSYYFVVGKVDFAIPLIGYAAKFINSTAGKIIIAAVYIAWAAVEIELYIMKRKAYQED